MDEPRVLNFKWSVAAVVAAALMATACGGGGSDGTLEPSEDGVLRVVADDTMDFDADAYSAAAGEIAIEYVLSGFQEHTLVVEGYEDELALSVENGGSDSGTITLEAGRYTLYCDIPGHREGGMEARLLVQ
jgi:uncharacterized cupredoxin-like copper-binding protein|tara:strand:- start:48 stop:440 length:393 start_codon:yes stop_codon:yes gene_type:complete